MALMELTLQYRYAGQLCINRWNYVSTGTPAAVSLSFALVSAATLDNINAPLAGSMIGAIRDAMVEDVQFIDIAARDVYSDLDFYTSGLTFTGTVEEPGSPPFISIGFRTNRIRADIGRGTKRFSGVPESVQGELGQVAPTFIAALNNIAQEMSTVLSYDDEGNSISFTPAVTAKIQYTPDPLKPERKAYRYRPNDAAGQLAATAVGVTWEPYTTIRSQVSRQIGRGQ